MFNPETVFVVLEKVTGILDRCGICYYLTGGLASIYYSEPRLTQDADLVVDPDQLATHLDAFIAALQSMDYLISEPTIREAVRRGKMFQVIDAQEMIKVDFYPREFVPGAIDRSVPGKLTDSLTVPIASVPDLIVSKLVWISKGGHKSRRDVRQLMRIASEVEQSQSFKFAEDLGLTHLFEEVLAEPDEIDLD